MIILRNSLMCALTGAIMVTSCQEVPDEEADVMSHSKPVNDNSKESEKGVSKVEDQSKGAVIGGQEWMKANLSLKIFRNGDSIRHAQDLRSWRECISAGEPCWCFGVDSSGAIDKENILYNYSVVCDKRKIAPQGWIIPSQSDWKSLIDHEGGTVDLDNLRCQTGWLSLGLDKYGFNAKSYGGRFDIRGVDFDGAGETAYFWTDCVSSSHTSIVFSLRDSYSMLAPLPINYGLSIRCLKAIE